MKIEQLLIDRPINPILDVMPNFECIYANKTYGMGSSCISCGSDRQFQKHFESIPWTAVRYCRKCEKLSVVYYQDPMSGVYFNKLEVYE